MAGQTSTDILESIAQDRANDITDLVIAEQSLDSDDAPWTETDSGILLVVPENDDDLVIEVDGATIKVDYELGLDDLIDETLRAVAVQDSDGALRRFNHAGEEKTGEFVFEYEIRIPIRS